MKWSYSTLELFTKEWLGNCIDNIKYGWFIYDMDCFETGWETVLKIFHYSIREIKFLVQLKKKKGKLITCTIWIVCLAWLGVKCRTCCRPSPLMSNIATIPFIWTSGSWIICSKQRRLARKISSQEKWVVFHMPKRFGHSLEILNHGCYFEWAPRVHVAKKNLWFIFK